ncbi:unnamed protein product [Hydatigera taeniaeformis]|uniref:Lebercilin domain-containing protein n=1 Tax=Hydatigena taeniaeformis TaxID=6205 RepID=A0A0R3WTG5_HYDTA|nr:unnamed protein product [Hydatigera taeniaeformis]
MSPLGSSTPGTYVAPSLPTPSAQHKLQQQRRYRRHRSGIRGCKSSQQQRRQYHHRLQPSLETELSLEAWQASQNLIASLRSENHLLQNQLKECRVELRTVQRQCKVQSARLSKAVGREAEMPALVDRLNAEVRAMQIQLRRKQEAIDVAERRALEAEARLLPLLGKRNHKSATVSSPPSANEQEEMKRRTQALDAMQTTLEEERRKFRARRYWSLGDGTTEGDVGVEAAERTHGKWCALSDDRPFQFVLHLLHLCNLHR